MKQKEIKETANCIYQMNFHSEENFLPEFPIDPNLFDIFDPFDAAVQKYLVCQEQSPPTIQLDLPSMIDLFERKYFKKRYSLLPEQKSRIVDGLLNLYRDYENITFDRAKAKDLRRLQKTDIYFSQQLLKAIKPLLNSAMEGIKGLLMAIIVHLLMHNESSNPEIDRLQEEFAVTILSLPDSTCISFEERSRLFEFFRIIHVLKEIYPPKNNKGMFIFVAQLLEGKPDLLNRLYCAGGEMSAETLRRTAIFEFVTGVEKRIRSSSRSQSDTEEEEEEEEEDEDEFPDEESQGTKEFPERKYYSALTIDSIEEPTKLEEWRDRKKRKYSDPSPSSPHEH
jgi:hypothetical protein